MTLMLRLKNEKLYKTRLINFPALLQNRLYLLYLHCTIFTRANFKNQADHLERSKK